MKMSRSERQQIENEMIFRRENERVSITLEKMNKEITDQDNKDLAWDDSVTIEFYCECSDEECDQRIPVRLSTYQKIHSDRKNFILKPGHQVDEIEKVRTKHAKYWVVNKNKMTSDPGKDLNETTVDNV